MPSSPHLGSRLGWVQLATNRTQLQHILHAYKIPSYRCRIGELFGGGFCHGIAWGAHFFCNRFWSCLTGILTYSHIITNRRSLFAEIFVKFFVFLWTKERYLLCQHLQKTPLEVMLFVRRVWYWDYFGVLRNGNHLENHARMENHSVAAVRKLYSVFDSFAELSHWQWYVVFYMGFIVNTRILYEELCCKSAVASSATLRNVGLLVDMFKLRT